MRLFFNFSQIHGTREKDQLHKYEYEANFWCNKHNCKTYFAFLRTSPFTGDERLYLNEHHKNVWKVIRRKDLVNLFNKHSNVVNNIYLDYVERLNLMDKAVQSFRTNNVKTWNSNQIVGFCEFLETRILDNTGWKLNHTRSGEFWGFYWHWVECRNKKFSYYLQIEFKAEITLCLRIESYSIEESERKADRSCAIDFLERNLDENDLKMIEKSKFGKAAEYMTIKHIKQDVWLKLIDDSNGIIDLGETVKQLEYISSVLDKLG